MHITKKHHGYTLLELSISISLIALLLTSGLTLFSKVDDKKRMQITLDRMAAIQVALDKFQYKNHYLPCGATADPTAAGFHANPAFNTIASIQIAAANNSISGVTMLESGDIVDIANSATASNNGTFTVVGYISSANYSVAGKIPLVDDITNLATLTIHSCGPGNDFFSSAVPVSDLGLDNEYLYDGWERFFFYRVAQGMGSATDFADPRFTGDLRIIDLKGNEKTNTDKSPPYNEGAAYVLMSHGPSGVGAITKFNKTRMVSPPPVGSAKFTNANYNDFANKTYIQDTITNSVTYSDANGAGLPQTVNFDDILVYKKKSDFLQAKLSKSPVLISASVCNNARNIATGSIQTGMQSGISSTYDQVITASARAVKTLCDNQAPTCNLSPFNVAQGNLILWLDASDPFGSGNLPPDQYTLATWYDKSGNHNDAVAPAPGNAPTFLLAPQIADYFPATKSAVRFTSASNNYLVTNANIDAYTNPFVTLFFVFYERSGGGNKALYGQDTSNIPADGDAHASLGNRYATLDFAGAVGNVPAVNAGAYGVSLGTYDDTTYHSVTVPYNTNAYSVSGYFTNITIVLENNVPGSSTSYTSGIYRYARPAITFTESHQLPGYNTTAIAAVDPAGHYSSDVDIAEIIFYNKALSDTERNTVEAYLRNKWFSTPCDATNAFSHN